MKAFILAGPSAWKCLSQHLTVKRTLLERLSGATLYEIEPFQWAFSSHQIHSLDQYLLTLQDFSPSARLTFGTGSSYAVRPGGGAVLCVVRDAIACLAFAH